MECNAKGRPMRRLLSALCLILLPGAALHAEDAISGAEFEAYSTGKTLFYATEGQAYGAEQYLSGRRVVWTFLDGECTEGVWYEVDDQICFRYRHDPDEPQCWSFFRTGSGLTARFENDPTQTELVEINQSQDPLICTGPKVGV